MGLKKLQKLNESLIKKVLKHIEAFPETYKQNDIVSPVAKTSKTPCGAIGCFGGWATLLSMPKSKRLKFAEAVELGPWSDGVSKDLVNPMSVLGRAAKLLGLTYDEADYLFAGTDRGGYKNQYKVICKRVEMIRAARKAVLQERCGTVNVPQFGFEGGGTQYLEYICYVGLNNKLCAEVNSKGQVVVEA